MITSYDKFNEAAAFTSRRSSALEYEELLDTYMNHCRYFPMADTVEYNGLVRGLATPPFEYGVIDPNLSTRRSRDNGNHYNLLIANAPGWSDYPDRLKSVIFTNNREIASDYGFLYYVIPFDDAKVAVAPATDIWECFPGWSSVIGVTFTGLTELLDQAAVPDDSWEDMKGAVDDLYEMWRDDISSVPIEAEPLHRLFDKAAEQETTWDQVLFGLLERHRHNFHTTYALGGLVRGDDNEMWTEGKCLLVKNVHFKQFREDVLKKLQETA